MDPLLEGSKEVWAELHAQGREVLLPTRQKGKLNYLKYKLDSHGNIDKDNIETYVYVQYSFVRKPIVAINVYKEKAA